MPPRYDEMIGSMLLGRYQIVRRLAAGGMGVVYLARARGAAGFAKPVVIKRILPGLAANREFAGMFIREAQILSHLHHPGIVDVIDFAEEDGAYIMVLEYVHGFQLGQWHRYLRSRGKQIPGAVVIQIIINTLDALHHAHSLKRPDGEWMQIIHRDISPSNILIRTDGHSMLVDFGIARISGSNQGYKTQAKSFKGKLSYTAPEIFQGGRASVMSDVYSCGVVLHEILIGVNDFRGVDYPETFGRVLNHLPVSVHGYREDVPDEIDAVIGKALAKSPEKRYQSAAEFSAVLRRLHRVDERQMVDRIAKLTHDDFCSQMAAYLEVESLEKLDSAWRNPSISPQRVRRAADDSISDTYTIGDEERQDESGDGDEASEKAARVEDDEPATKVLFRVKSAFPKSRMARAWLGIATMVLLAAGAALAITSRESKKEERRFLLVQSPIESESPSDKRPVDKEKAASEANRQVSKAALPSKDGVEQPETKIEGSAKLDLYKKGASEQPLKRGSKRTDDPDVQALTRAFRNREKQIHSCVETHAVELQGKPKVSVLFNIDRFGVVNSAEISPDALNRTELGRCILAVARSTKFPPQKEPVSFHIPVTVWRVSRE
ncbi:MAG: serine/threonine protein kinase [Deltaproteobacteria bacterium]|nr:serine/threonine protein kinase [Deltaproteobacteria bacterium]